MRKRWEKFLDHAFGPKCKFGVRTHGIMSSGCTGCQAECLAKWTADSNIAAVTQRALRIAEYAAGFDMVLNDRRPRGPLMYNNLCDALQPYRRNDENQLQTLRRILNHYALAQRKP